MSYSKLRQTFHLVASEMNLNDLGYSIFKRSGTELPKEQPSFLSSLKYNFLWFLRCRSLLTWCNTVTLYCLLSV